MKKKTQESMTVLYPFLRKVIVIFLISALILFAFFTWFYYFIGIKSCTYLLYINTLQHIIWLFGFLYFKDLAIESIIRMYLAYIMLAFYPITCINWNSDNSIVFFWYFLILLGAIIFDRHNMVVWIFLILFIVVSIFLVSPLFPHENITPEVIRPVNILTIITIVILGSFFAIAYIKMLNINESMLYEMSRTSEENEENSERFRSLYDTIIEYLERSESFKKTDFNAQSLAKALNTNVNYISKAINRCSIGDFNTLLNDFRIKYIKYRLDNGALKKYSIDHIYTEAGYKNRSTFYIAFKRITGMTPTDYVSQQNTNKS